MNVKDTVPWILLPKNYEMQVI